MANPLVDDLIHGKNGMILGALLGFSFFSLSDNTFLLLNTFGFYSALNSDLLRCITQCD